MSKYTECMKSELDLFAKPAIQSNVIKTEEVAYKPIASLDNANVLEFVSLGHGDTYRDLSSIYLKIKLKIKKDAKDDHTDSSTGVANNLLHSLFRQCSIYLNGKPTSQTDNNYSYRAYIENLLNYGNDAATTHLESVGWYVDTPEKLDELKDKENVGLDKRKKLVEKSCIVELMGKIHGDMLNQPKLLLNNVDLRVALSLEKPEFYIMEEDTKTSIAQILDATLYMNHVTINPGILLAHEAVLQHKNAHYPYKRVEVKSYTISSGNLSFSLDNVIIGQLPNFLLFCMVDNESYRGKRSKNPFNFKTNEISSFNLSVNGILVPQNPLTFDYAKAPFVSTRAYTSLFRGIGINYHDKGNLISKEFFDNGCFMLAFDLTADLSGNSDCANLLNQGTVRVEARFAKELATTVTCIVYTEFDASIEIDKNRNVITSF